MALGAVAVSAQNPCEDVEGQGALGDKFRELYSKRDIPGRKSAIESGKQFLEKYGSCPSTTDLSEYLKKTLPIMEENLKKAEIAEDKSRLANRFDAALRAAVKAKDAATKTTNPELKAKHTAEKIKNFDEVYASGKEILGKYADDFRAAMFVLGSIGYDESFDGNFKYNDDTIRYAKMAIADLEAGKEFSSFGVSPFLYKSKEDALGWMNLTIGYIQYAAKKDKISALPHLYKATQSTSDTKDNPIPFELIGAYYFEELNKLIDQLKALEADQKETDTPEIIQQKVDAIKAKVGLVNGTAERAIDAYGRAYSLGNAKAYKDKMYKNTQDAYRLRFEKLDGLDTWLNGLTAKPFPNPTTAVTPVNDPEPVGSN